MSSSPDLKVIRRVSFKAVPWKNGGGITHEALRVPAAGDPFEWRVSVAHIDSSGPFSEFSEYERKMVLLEGKGITLRFGDGSHKALRSAGELVEFDGALPAHGELVDGPCMDLNLMVRKTRAVEARVLRISRERLGAGGAVVLAFPIDRAIALVPEQGVTSLLGPWDLAVLSAGSVRIEARGDAAEALVFVARVGPAAH